MTAAVLCLFAVLAAAPQPEVRNVRIVSPKILLSREKSDSDVQIAGQFKVEMTFAKESVRKPVMRLVCLSQLNGAIQANCVLLDKPETAAGMSQAEILSALKRGGIRIESKNREAMLSDPAKFTPYAQEMLRTSSSLSYGSSDLKKGFFRLGKSGSMPKLLLFRIEVWQNGSMVARHESSHAGLGSLNLPKDWYAWKKYPDRFKYADIR